MFTLAYERNEMNYVWMNETDSMFAKEGFLVEVPYVDPSFMGSLDVKSMIPKSDILWTNNMNDVICYMQYVVWYV